MTHAQLDTPVLLLGFIRADTAQKVFNEIRKAKPKQFFLAVDGPRENRPDDEALCQKTRELAKQVDWECEVHTLFQEKNLGCGYGSVAAIDWMFKHVEEGIIFDDDCVPDPSFFYFCQEMLGRYRDNKKIMHISGDNFQFGRKRGNASYYFSKYTLNWGWATWRRAWKYNDINLISPELRQHVWDAQWLKSVRRQGGLSIMPNVNLITNIGFGADATHTTVVDQFAGVPSQAIEFPLVHPRFIVRNYIADFYTFRTQFHGLEILSKRLKRLLPQTVRTSLKSAYRKIIPHA
jgi:hypothetical protein